MPNFVATILNVMPKSNPEYCYLSVDAENEAGAKRLAQAVIRGDLRGLGWTSYRDPELWGKVQTVLVDVTTESEHIARAGQGNTRGSEGQDDREVRFRKAAKV